VTSIEILENFNANAEKLGKRSPALDRVIAMMKRIAQEHPYNPQP
jgi:hypothetical protein